jgi:hypothetical protein
MPQQHDYPDLPAPKAPLIVGENKSFNRCCPACGQWTLRSLEKMPAQFVCNHCLYVEPLTDADSD